MKNPNIFQIWKSIGERIPFKVRRDTWTQASYLIVHDVHIKKYPYGDATGILYFNGKPKTTQPEPVSCAGCYQWELIEDSESRKEEFKQNRKLKVYDKNDYFDFGKYSQSKFGKNQRTIEQVFKEDPTYIKWCLTTIESFCLVPDQLKELNPTEGEQRIGGRLRKINYDRYESLMPNKEKDNTTSG